MDMGNNEFSNGLQSELPENIGNKLSSKLGVLIKILSMGTYMSFYLLVREMSATDFTYPPFCGVG